MRYKQKRRIKLIIILAIMAFAAFLYFQHGINLGLDLQGGAHIVLQAQPTEEREINDTVMSGIQSVIERRVNQLGLTEPLIQRQGSDRIIVELPAVDSPNEAINTIGRTAMLTFRNSAGEVLMTGEAVKDARADHDQYGRPVIAFTLTDEGSKQFANITRQYIGEKIGIYLDDERLTNPTVQAVIEERGQITGYESIQAAEEDAILIREGALPVPVEVIETRTVGPTLGSISIQKSIKAGLIGLLLVAIYMVFYYRFPGVLAAVILAIYGLILMGTMAGLQATLTLPGIAGLILSIGMAVDANIIIFERIKDELKSGKTLRAAIDSGFKRAYTTIIDANVTTIMTALILAYFTSGTVRGFAVTLGIGIIVSMFTAFFVTRNVIDIFAGSKLLRENKSFGVRKG
ncbi:preprotein translocase subunit SecD [Halanaerobium congolense]|jgi:preprotein translocase subunit SecD|uniref:Protein translocase subunit SecD n=1 Tax=Halanaerobium congolense TaxID=54121 RepID=A0A1G6PKJ9_9FIRM|nr:protein translocase subunit SecD [Halanaerobium congolense]KXS50561.1 MAG: preprotein translocase subunit SecD [Halanaerobium sp. T82-1]OEG62341.1 MAG: protein-export membrane protein SecD [Halanaerobium sp. MDAL1]PTX16812.1 preprotein translocase subunit SecD [Halanaerobium congolense]PXV66381.1 preprotein translocase subunit SecD [Halanaerobium congolense]TDP11076.1 preprotein translocase subunit SecD [Halanaerobium congolense]